MKKLPYFVSFAAAWLFIAVASAREESGRLCKSVRRNDGITEQRTPELSVRRE